MLQCVTIFLLYESNNPNRYGCVVLCVVCVAVCCSVLQCVAVCHTVSPLRVEQPQQFWVCCVVRRVHCSVLQCFAVLCNALQCLAVCFSDLQ